MLHLPHLLACCTRRCHVGKQKWDEPGGRGEYLGGEESAGKRIWSWDGQQIRDHHLPPATRVMAPLTAASLKWYTVRKLTISTSATKLCKHTNYRLSYKNEHNKTLWIWKLYLWGEKNAPRRINLNSEKLLRLLGFWNGSVKQFIFTRTVGIIVTWRWTLPSGLQHGTADVRYRDILHGYVTDLHGYSATVHSRLHRPLTLLLYQPLAANHLHHVNIILLSGSLCMRQTRYGWRRLSRGLSLCRYSCRLQRLSYYAGRWLGKCDAHLQTLSLLGRCIFQHGTIISYYKPIN